MDGAGDGERVDSAQVDSGQADSGQADARADTARIAASLAAALDRLVFRDRQADDVTALIVDAVVAWAGGQGWRVYRRAPSVMSLPAPYQHRRSVVDVGCARQGAAPVVIEVDRTDRRRSVEKLLAEAAAGRIAIWVRWGTGRIEPPPLPVGLVRCQVTARRGLVEHDGRAARRTLYSHVPASDRPAPQHTAAPDAPARQSELFPQD